MFLLSLALFFSFFRTDPVFGLRGTNIYVRTDSTVYVNDASGTFSQMYLLYQKGDTAGAQALLNFINFEYPTNIDIYYYNGTALHMYVSNHNNTFAEKLQFSRYLIYTVNRSIPSYGVNVHVSPMSSISNKNAEVNVSVHNPLASPLSNAQLRVDVYYNNDTQVNWVVANNPQIINVPALGTVNTTFNVTVPADALADQYYITANLTSSLLNERGYAPFNVLVLGFLKAEVGIV